MVGGKGRPGRIKGGSDLLASSRDNSRDQEKNVEGLKRVNSNERKLFSWGGKNKSGL